MSASRGVRSPRVSTRALGALSLGCVAALAVSAQARPFSARGFVSRDENGFTLDEPLYDSFLGDVLGALRPRFGGTGRTGGAAGLELSLGFGWSPVSPSSAAWQAAMGDRAPDAIAPLLLAVRKGLPGGFALGAHLAYADALDVVSPSIELRWAIVEGHDVLPDVGMRLDAGAVVGNPEATLAHAGIELIVGRQVPVQGLLTVAPYGGYAFRYGRTLERQVAAIEDGEAHAFETVLPGQNVFLHHAIIGLRIDARPLAVDFETHIGTTTGLQLSVGAAF